MVIRMVLGLALAMGMAAAQDAAVDNRAVVEMVEKGVAPELIVEAIRSAPEARFRFTPDDYAEFTRVKLGPAILKAMYDRQQSGAVRPAAAPVPAQVSPQASRQAATATRGPQAAPARVDEYLSAGTNELAVSGNIVIPHIDAGGTNGSVIFGYQRYLKSWLSIGPAVRAQFFGSDTREVSALGNVQFSPRLGDRVYWLAGAGVGVNHVSVLGASDTNLLVNAYTGPRFFFNRNVAMDVLYNFTWRRFPDAGFSAQTSSGVNFGLAFVF